MKAKALKTFKNFFDISKSFFYGVSDCIIVETNGQLICIEFHFLLQESETPLKFNLNGEEVFDGLFGVSENLLEIFDLRSNKSIKSFSSSDLETIRHLLNPGFNKFIIDSHPCGLYYYKENTKLIITTIDVISSFKSFGLYEALTLGAVKFFSEVGGSGSGSESNFGSHAIVYLSNKGVFEINSLRKTILGAEEEGCFLPRGAILCVPDGPMSYYRRLLLLNDSIDFYVMICEKLIALFGGVQNLKGLFCSGVNEARELIKLTKRLYIVDENGYVRTKDKKRIFEGLEEEFK